MTQLLYNVSYSKLLSVPYLNSVLYAVQIFLIEGEILHRCWVSGKDHPERQKLLSAVQQRADVLMVSAWQLGRDLQTLQKKYVLDYNETHPKNRSLADLYCLVWALTYAQSVTIRSVKKLGNILPESVPIWHPYIISVHQALDTQCDFIWQTIQQLQRDGSVVHILSHVHQPQHIIEQVKKMPRVWLHFSVVPQWTNILPHRLLVQFRHSWKQFLKQKLTALSAGLASPVFWCFDPDDARVLSVRPRRSTMVYDCVDYFSSLNPRLQTRITKDQNRLIDVAHLMFVNSKSLLKVHGAQRSDITLVPQGFDEQSFTRNVPLTTASRPFFQTLTRLQNVYRKTVSYIGMMSYRIDYQLLTQLIKSSPSVLFCLPEMQLRWLTEDQYVAQEEYIEKLSTMKNVLWYPPLNRQEVMRLLGRSSAGLIPYNAQLRFNVLSFPMKFFEYMYMHLPTVSTPIQELKQYSEFVYIGRNQKELKAALRKALRKTYTPAERQTMTRLCHSHSWEKKVGRIVGQINQYQRKHHFSW
jgi:hypothetical protein